MSQLSIRTGKNPVTLMKLQETQSGPVYAAFLEEAIEVYELNETIFELHPGDLVSNIAFDKKIKNHNTRWLNLETEIHCFTQASADSADSADSEDCVVGKIQKIDDVLRIYLKAGAYKKLTGKGSLMLNGEGYHEPVWDDKTQKTPEFLKSDFYSVFNGIRFETEYRGKPIRGAILEVGKDMKLSEEVDEIVSSKEYDPFNWPQVVKDEINKLNKQRMSYGKIHKFCSTNRLTLGRKNKPTHEFVKNANWYATSDDRYMIIPLLTSKNI